MKMTMTRIMALTVGVIAACAARTLPHNPMTTSSGASGAIRG
jgi:hypothetical protein